MVVWNPVATDPGAVTEVGQYKYLSKSGHVRSAQYRARYYTGVPMLLGLIYVGMRHPTGKAGRRGSHKKIKGRLLSTFPFRSYG
jgi:hypothetical protein